MTKAPIQQIRLKNFQGHADSTLEFHPGVNVITGQSDAGKSSVVRAIFWAWANRPAGGGDLFRHNKATGRKIEVSVFLGLDDGQVTRFKQGAENGYVVSGKKLVAIRKDVPNEVVASLRLGEHNIQTQHQPYFLLADSPADVARKLNEVCGLDIIDRCLSNANTCIGQNRQQITECEGQIRGIEDNLLEYGDLNEREEWVGAVEEQTAKLEELDARVTELTTTIDGLEQTQAAIDDLTGFLEVESYLEPLRERIVELDGLDTQIENLTALIEQGARQDKEVHRMDAELGELESKLHGLLKDCGVCPLCGQETVR